MFNQVFIQTSGLEEHVQQLSWWLVGSRVNTVSNKWVLAQLHKVQGALGKGLYTEEHIAALKVSLAIWTRSAINKTKNLNESFCASSRVIAEHQLTNLLRLALVN